MDKNPAYCSPLCRQQHQQTAPVKLPAVTGNTPPDPIQKEWILLVIGLPGNAGYWLEIGYLIDQTPTYLSVGLPETIQLHECVNRYRQQDISAYYLLPHPVLEQLAGYLSDLIEAAKPLMPLIDSLRVKKQSVNQCVLDFLKKEHRSGYGRLIHQQTIQHLDKKATRTKA